MSIVVPSSTLFPLSILYERVQMRNRQEFNEFSCISSQAAIYIMHYKRTRRLNIVAHSLR